MSDPTIVTLMGRHRYAGTTYTSAHGLRVHEVTPALITCQRRAHFQVVTPSDKHRLTFTLLRDAKRYVLAHADELYDAWQQAGSPVLWDTAATEALPPGKSR